MYVYDALGRLAGEFASTGTHAPPCGTCYLSYDHLGSVRLVTDQSGAVVSRHDYLPFGEEIASGTAGRTSQFGAGDNLSQRFTGKERDSESGLDYFGARYYGSALGRFTSPDPSKLSVLPTYPQTWNRYSYVYNNPLALKDDNGKWPTSIHNQIIDKAFPNLTPAQRQILKNVSAKQDGILNGGQSKALSFEHAMRAPGQSVADAQAKYNDFVQTKEGSANNLQIWMSDPDAEFTTLTPEALEAFGAALHAIEDSLSPAHEGFQIWDYNPLHVMQHHNTENYISPQQMQKAVDAARNAFDNTFSFFGFTASDDIKGTVTTSQGPLIPCGGNTGHPCP